MIPFLREDIINVPDCGLISVGVATQWTIYAQGNRVLKRRPTHDASRPEKSGYSVNNMCDKDLIDKSLIGFCLLRILHQVHAMSLFNSSIPILFNKTDLDAAYRRLHVVIRFTLLCITIIERIAYLLV